jgi:hypothetical protein
MIMFQRRITSSTGREPLEVNSSNVSLRLLQKPHESHHHLRCKSVRFIRSIFLLSVVALHSEVRNEIEFSNGSCVVFIKVKFIKSFQSSFKNRAQWSRRIISHSRLSRTAHSGQGVSFLTPDYTVDEYHNTACRPTCSFQENLSDHASRA